MAPKVKAKAKAKGLAKAKAKAAMRRMPRGGAMRGVPRRPLRRPARADAPPIPVDIKEAWARGDLVNLRELGTEALVMDEVVVMEGAVYYHTSR